MSTASTMFAAWDVRRSASSRGLVVALLLALGLGAACSPTNQWRDQTLALKAQGYAFKGTKLRKVAWSGSGVWIDEHTMVTNAHVATRALRLRGTDDRGQRYRFTKVLAIDGANDIAVLHARRGNEDVSTELVDERPEDPKDLRGTKVLAIGNTGGQGLSVYNGQVTNYLRRGRYENIVHSADISSGSSGGPLWDDSGRLLGINKSINLRLRQSFATPAWVVKRVLRKGRRNDGASLKEAFSPRKLPMAFSVKRRFCLNPGQKIVAPIAVVGTADIVAAVKFKTAGTPLFFGLVRGRSIMSKGLLTKNLFAAWGTPGPGVYKVVLVNPKKMTKQACGIVGLGRVAWEKRLK
ncbi:MAG: trypsin-like peptidase domain-containing protein [Myxococcales bacterium]|nr:trypsin-like peptidase domain-containing protein [Myxococcales bacterium]